MLKSEIFIQRKDQGKNEKFESQFQSEAPYIEQTAAWKAGMQYRWSPDNYDLSKNQVDRFLACGELLGSCLDKKYQNLLEFRVDFVPDKDGILSVAEVQTDDRGFPAMANIRNSRKNQTSFPGLSESFVKALEKYSGKTSSSMIVVFPDEEKFYYAGFNDVAYLLWGLNPTAEVIVTPKSCVTQLSPAQLLVDRKREGYKIPLKPDFIWDFSESLAMDQLIQPKVDKQLLLDIWTQNDSISKKLRAYIPEARPASDPDVQKDKNEWVLKPIDGKWSKGVTLGVRETRQRWKEKIESQGKELLAQRLVEPQSRWFSIRKKPGVYVEQPMYSRVEGYYTKNPGGGWQLADVLATCTPEIPVHGMRECIMIPGIISLSEEEKNW